MNGDTATRSVLTESLAQSMERLLDTYLLDLDDRFLVMYGIDKKILQDDINRRNISTYIQRLKSVSRVEKVMPNFGEKALESGYMLAQIYSTEFSTLSFDKQKTTISSLIDCVTRDDFNGAINIFGIDISKDNVNRKNIIDYINEKNIGYYNSIIRAKSSDEKTL